jgi:hypothetical protein
MSVEKVLEEPKFPEAWPFTTEDLSVPTTEQRADSRVESREQRAESREQRAESRKLLLARDPLFCLP